MTTNPRVAQESDLTKTIQASVDQLPVLKTKYYANEIVELDEAYDNLLKRRKSVDIGELLGGIYDDGFGIEAIATTEREKTLREQLIRHCFYHLQSKDFFSEINKVNVQNPNESSALRSVSIEIPKYGIFGLDDNTMEMTVSWLDSRRRTERDFAAYYYPRIPESYDLNVSFRHKYPNSIRNKLRVNILADLKKERRKTKQRPFQSVPPEMLSEFAQYKDQSPKEGEFYAKTTCNIEFQHGTRSLIKKAINTFGRENVYITTEIPQERWQFGFGQSPGNGSTEFANDAVIIAKDKKLGLFVVTNLSNEFDPRKAAA